MNKTIANIPTVSASKIITYKVCAKQYEYKYKTTYNDRPIDDKNVAALLGTALHKAIELKYRSGINAIATFQQVMEETITQWEKEKLKINFAGYYTTAMNVGSKILRTFDWNQFAPIELEYAFTLPFPNKANPIVNMTGYIDLIDRRGWVIDHKSASQAPSINQLTHNPQFFIYSWAYQQIYKKKPKHIYWNHLRTNRLYEYSQDDYQFKLDQLTQDITAMINAQYFARKELDNTCLTKCSFYTLCYGEKQIVGEE